MLKNWFLIYINRHYIINFISFFFFFLLLIKNKISKPLFKLKLFKIKAMNQETINPKI